MEALAWESVGKVLYDLQENGPLYGRPPEDDMWKAAGSTGLLRSLICQDQSCLRSTEGSFSTLLPCVDGPSLFYSGGPATGRHGSCEAEILTSIS